MVERRRCIIGAARVPSSSSSYFLVNTKHKKEALLRRHADEKQSRPLLCRVRRPATVSYRATHTHARTREREREECRCVRTRPTTVVGASERPSVRSSVSLFQYYAFICTVCRPLDKKKRQRVLIALLIDTRFSPHSGNQSFVSHRKKKSSSSSSCRTVPKPACAPGGAFGRILRRSRTRSVRLSSSHDHSSFPGGNSKNDRILCPLRPLCFTLAVDLRDTTRRGRFSKATTPFLLEGLS